MRKRVTVSLDEDVYRDLERTAGQRGIDRLIAELIRLHFIRPQLDAGYRAMAADGEREREAGEWINGLSADLTDEAR